MFFDQLYFHLATIKPSFLSLILQASRWDAYQEDEQSLASKVIMGLLASLMIIGPIVLLISILKDFISHFIFRIPAFSPLYRFVPKNIRLAYKIVGCHVVVSDGGNRREQYLYLISYLKRHFPKAGPISLREIPNLHEFYTETHEVFVWLNKHLDQEHKLQFIDFMVNLAFFNEKLSKREMNLIYAAGHVFGIPRNEVKSILTMRFKFYQDKRRREQEHRRKSRTTRRPSRSLKNEALKILGLAQNVTDFDVVKKAYRNMAKKHHPDRFHNDSDQERERAHERFTAINTAYEYLEKALN